VCEEDVEDAALDEVVEQVPVSLLRYAGTSIR
jgi:hypothetical protein